MQTRQPPNGPPCGSVVGIQLSKINEGGEGCNAVYPSRGLLTRLPRRIRLSPSPVVIVARHRDCASRSEVRDHHHRSRRKRHHLHRGEGRRSLRPGHLGLVPRAGPETNSIALATGQLKSPRGTTEATQTSHSLLTADRRQISNSRLAAQQCDAGPTRRRASNGGRTAARPLDVGGDDAHLRA